MMTIFICIQSEKWDPITMFTLEACGDAFQCQVWNSLCQSCIRKVKIDNIKSCPVSPTKCFQPAHSSSYTNHLNPSQSSCWCLQAWTQHYRPHLNNLSKTKFSQYRFIFYNRQREGNLFISKSRYQTSILNNLVIYSFLQLLTH